MIKNIIKKKNATNVASMAMHKVLVKLNNKNGNKHINLSVDEVALMVMHQSNKLGLSRLPGSNPGWGASTLKNSNFLAGGFKEK